MASPRLICKSAYITSTAHFFNSIEYAGNKIHKQEVVYRDGSIREVEGDKTIKLFSSEQPEILGVRITFKDGKVSRPISYDRYLARVGMKGERVTVSEVSEVSDDAQAFRVDMPQVDDAPRNLWDMSFDKYIGYIANREGVVKEEGHGLFGLGGNIPIDEAKALALEHEDSRKWSHIISMDTEDAKSTGYDNREMWKHLIVAKAPEIAKAYNIRLQNLVINCAYHGNTDNPHVHLMFYSKDHTDGFVKGGTAAMNKATEKLKSTLVGEIFKGENASLGAEKSKLRKQIMETLKLQIGELAREPLGADVMNRLEALSMRLETVQGKKEYEWLPAELKQKVDDVLRSAIDSSPQLTQAFNEYSRAQEKLIARYIMSPERLEEKLAQWKERFFHPNKSDLRQHHNIIIKAAAHIEETRSQWLRTFGEENVHVSTADLSLSSNSVSEDANMPPDSMAEPDYWLPGEPAMERTYGEEMFDFDMDNDNVSSDKFAFAQEQPELATMEYLDELQSSDPIQGAFRKALRKAMVNIFNPKTTNTALQDHALELLYSLREINQQAQSDAENNQDCIDTRQEIFRVLYNTDDEYRQAVNTHMDDIKYSCRLQFGETGATKCMALISQEMSWGTSPLLDSIDQYAANLDDNMYYQILEAYKELNTPLNKSIHRTLNENVPDNSNLQCMMQDIADVSEYLGNKECEKYVKGRVKDIMSELKQYEGYSDTVSAYIKQYHDVIAAHMPQKQVSYYQKRFEKTFSGVLMLMRPHLTIVQKAKHIDEIFYHKVVHDKTFQAPLKKLLRKHLDDCLLDTEFFSSAVIKDKLERLHMNDDTSRSAEIVSCLYRTSDEFRRMVDNHIGVLYDKLKTVMKPDAATEYADKYRDELLGGEYLPLHSSIKWYAHTLPENYYRVLCKKHKEIFKPLNSKIIRGLWERIGSPQGIVALRELASTDPADINLMNTKVRDIVCGVVHEDELCQFTEDIAMQFKDVISDEVDPNTVQAFYERMRSDVYTAQLSSTSFIVQSFAAELDTHLAEVYLKQQLKSPVVKQFRSELYQSMVRLHKKGGAQYDRLQLLTMYSGDRKCYNEIMDILSPDNGDSLPLLQQNLYRTLFHNYCNSADPPLAYDKFSKVVDSFFYGENGNTFFFQEVVQQGATDTALPLPAFFIAKSMLSMLMRSIAGAAAQQSASPEEKHAFSAHKQFTDTKFKQPETFIQQY